MNAESGMMLIWLVVMIGLMYFLMIRPQKKEQNRIKAMLADMAVGDSIVTTSGFYGIVIDMTDEDVIVEFGNNKNCRIPMRKAAIAEVEKADAGIAEEFVKNEKIKRLSPQGRWPFFIMKCRCCLQITEKEKTVQSKYRRYRLQVRSWHLRSLQSRLLWKFLRHGCKLRSPVLLLWNLSYGRFE